MYFFDMAPSFVAREAHRYLNNRLGIFLARGGGLLDHPYAPCHPPCVPPTEEHLVGHLTNYCLQMSSCGLYIPFLYLDSVQANPFGNTHSFTITEVKQHWAQLVFGCSSFV